MGIENSKEFEAKKLELIAKYEPEFLHKETTEIRIYYSKDENVKTDLFLFNNKICKEQFASTRTWKNENNVEKFKIITDLVDQNFLSLITIIQLFFLKQKYIVESEIYKIGDLTVEFSKMYMETEKNKIKFFLCVNNPYGHKFVDTFDFIMNVMQDLFDNIDEKTIINSCEVNEQLLKKYSLINNYLKEEDNLNNIISEKFPQIKLIQYIEYLFG